MTEAEWTACKDPGPMRRELQKRAGVETEYRGWFAHPHWGTLPRKWRLFLAACCQRVSHFFGGEENPARQLIGFVQSLAEEPPSEADRERVIAWPFGNASSVQYRRLLQGLTSMLGHAAGELRIIVGEHAYRNTAIRTEKEAARRCALDAEECAQSEIIRDIFGNPFRPVSFSPAWRTDTAIALARQMYESREFGAMPILADALQDAGCDCEDILSHCRGEGVHVRGCWVVDLVLGKQ